MRLSIIVAMDENQVIGNNNQLPWHLPADLKHFKTITMGKPIIMGRKTFESIGKPLPGRQNIVVTRTREFHADGVASVHSIDEALELVQHCDEAMIIGGSQLFESTLSKANRLYLTYIHQHFTGDTFFPKFEYNEWQELSREQHEPDEKNPYAYTFITLEKK